MAILSLLRSFLLILLPVAAMAAEPLPHPAGPVVLTVTGEVGVTNAPDSAVFDLDLFSGLGTTVVDTHTIWTDGKIAFRGVPLNTFLQKLDAKGSTLRIWALNDYTVDIPFDDAAEGGPILAFEANGELLSVRDKGPIWLIYPYDSNDKYQTEVIYARSIWQINRIEILK